MRRWDAGCTLVLILTALYLLKFVDHGWIPHDEGLLAHSAERILGGEMPHRDFDEVYTGGLSYLHALALHFLGVKMVSLRIILLVFSLAYVRVLYTLVRRVTPPLVAGLIVMLCVAWSIPNYFAGLPSWYVLFCSLFGLSSLFRYFERRKGLTLFAAGLWGGLAFLVKSVGIYYVIAVLLALVYDEEVQAGMATEEPRAVSRLFMAVKSAALAGVVASLVALVLPRMGFMEIVHFVFPGSTICTFLLVSEWRHGCGQFRGRLRGLMRRLVPFASGVLIPIAALAVIYVVAGGLGQLLRGLFVLPQRRLYAASYQLPAPWSVVAAVPYTLLLAYSAAIPLQFRRMLFWSCTILAMAVPAFAWNEGVYRAVWYSVRPLVPVAVAVGCWQLFSADGEPVRRIESMALLSTVAFLSLVQYPYSYAIYFCYVAPLLILAVAFVVVQQPGSRTELHLCVAELYLAFAVAWLNTGSVRDIGIRYMKARQDTVLDQRGGLVVGYAEARLYAHLVKEVRAHSAPGSFIYAGPDCPEVYFLSARRNPTRTMYEFLDDNGPDGHERDRGVLRAIDSNDVRVAVINRNPEFSARISPALLRELRRRFSQNRRLGSFSVRWVR